jgi:hypothetical protein
MCVQGSHAVKSPTSSIVSSNSFYNLPTMPPMALTGIVTKAGCMQKTATVTVSRHVIHKLTGKVHFQFGPTKKYTHSAFSALSEAKRS